MINAAYGKSLIAILAVALVLILIFGSGSVSWPTMTGRMTGETLIGGYTLTWILTMLTLGLGKLPGWLLGGRK